MMSLGGDLIPPPSEPIPHAVYVERTKALEALESIASKIIEYHGSHETKNEDLHAGLRMWNVHRHLEYSKRRELDTEEISEIFRDEHRVQYTLSVMGYLFKAVKELHLDLKSHLKPISSKLAKGVFFLPDDVLSLIFEFANPPGEGTRQAVWFSLVCPRFRRVALGACNLWTTLHSNASTRELKALIARCGTESDLSIVLSIPSSDGLGLKQPDTTTPIFRFMDICEPLASRWRTLTIQSGSDVSEDPEEPETVDEMMHCLFDRYRLQLPRLQEIRITQRRFEVERGEDSWNNQKFTPSWSAPNLRSLICDDYIPSPSPMYSALRSFSTLFSLATDEYPSRFEDLHAFIDAGNTIRLENLSLTIRSFFKNMVPLQLTSTHRSSLTSLSLRFAPLIFPSGVRILVRPFMGSLVLPNLTTLSVSIEFRYDDLVNDPEDSDALQSLVYAILPDRKTHTKLTTLSIELTHDKGKEAWGESEVSDKILVVPLEQIPYVSSLSVKTFCELQFCDTRLGFEMFDGGARKKLREIRLHDFDHLEIESLQDMVTWFKEEGLWDTVETVKIERCFIEEACKEVAKVIGAERLSFVPRKGIKFFP